MAHMVHKLGEQALFFHVGGVGAALKSSENYWRGLTAWSHNTACIVGLLDNGYAAELTLPALSHIPPGGAHAVAKPSKGGKGVA